MSDHLASTIIFEGNVVEVGFIQTVLEDAGIFCAVQDEMMGTNFPWYVSAGGVGAVKLVVAQQDAAKAKELIAAFKSIQSNE